MRVRLVSVLAALTVGAAGPVGAQGTWIDIGINEPTYVICASDDVGWEYFPSFTFGPYYPPGTQVYAELNHVECHDLPESGCGSEWFVAGYVTTFDSGSCGCGGFLLETCRLHVQYNDETVQSRGVEETDLILIHFDDTDGWHALAEITVDTENNTIDGDVTGIIAGTQFYAVASGLPAPVERTSWGALKALWR